MYGRYDGLRHRYTVEASADGDNWQTIVDRSGSYKDTPNAYIELPEAVTARYVRYRNIDVPTPALAISEFRVFGLGHGKKPVAPRNLSVARDSDRRDAVISWTPVKGAQGYNVLWGIAPDKLYSSWMVYGDDSLTLRALTTDQSYYFAVEAFNENGVSSQTRTVFVE